MPCPCGSKIKYKNCCQRYHKGARTKDALTLMKSRYSAYAVGEVAYIIKTTHPDNPDYHDNKKEWRKSIMDFCQKNNFLDLEILSFEEKNPYAFVTFKASLSSGILHEKSRFIKSGTIWLYLDGEFKTSK